MGKKVIKAKYDNILGTELITLDYNSGSVGIDLGRVEDNISRIELRTIGIARHRLTEETIDIYLSADNISYQLLERNQWQYSRDPLGNITIELKDVSARYIKVHSKFTDRNADFEIVNIGEFKNILRELIRVYQRNEKAVINYEYDKVGNRTREIFNSGRMEIKDYIYYSGTNRLLTDGSYAYVYDEAGNLTKKGNRYKIEGDSVIFTETEGSGVEYWEYEYNLQNKLYRVRKNGELIAEFLYDTDGMRIKATEKIKEENTNRTTYYIYSYGGSVLMEESTDNGSSNSPETKYNSYIYAFGKIFAKVDGILDSTYITAEDVFYFHHDNLGSTRLMTDGAGNVVMEQDYMPFGEDLPVVGQTEVMDKEAGGYKYTGQKEVISIGLYYYGARYYDPSIGRFITEDSYPGEMENPQTQNLYVYVMNNPMKYVDPTGNFSEDEIERINSKLPEGINLEYGDYNESKYFLLTINLRINTNISFEFEWSMRNQELDKFYKENDIFVINAHFFGGNTISGDWITPEGGHQYSYIKEVPRWYVGMFKAEHIKDNIRFEFGRTQYDEFAKAPLIPESRRFEMGIGGIGGLLIDGEYVGKELEDAFDATMGTKSLDNAPRPAFGVDKNQETAFVFVGVSSWPLQKIADFVKERGVYNMVFLMEDLRLD